MQVDTLAISHVVINYHQFGMQHSR